MKVTNARIAIALATLVALLASATAVAGSTGSRDTWPLPGTLAFSSGTKAKGYQVFLMRPDGSTLQATHRAIRHDFPADPVWAPDGSRFAVVGEDGLYVAAADGSSETRLAGLSPGYARQGVAWSPDSRRLLFDASDAVYVVNADGSGGLERLPRAVSGGSWSPDGSRIVYTGADSSRRPAVFVVNAAGTPRPRQLYPTRGHPLRKGCWPGASWSPAGALIALDVGCGYSPLGGWISTIRPGGTGLAPLRQRGDLGPWSPNGRTLLVTQGFNAVWKLFRINVIGSTPKQLPDCSKGCWPVVWMPNSRAIAYNERGTIYVARADGSGRARVARTHADTWNLSVSPDGKTFAFAEVVGGEWGRQIAIASADGSGRRVISRSATVRYSAPNWRPR